MNSLIKKEAVFVSPFIIMFIGIALVSLFRANIDFDNSYANIAETFQIQNNLSFLLTDYIGINMMYVFLIVLLPVLQFNNLPNIFLFSLPIKKSKIIYIKLIFGMLSYTFGVIAHFLGILALRAKNIDIILDSFIHLPNEQYFNIVQSNSVYAIMTASLLLWSSLTVCYAVLSIICLCVRNKIFAGIIGFFSMFYMQLITEIFRDALYRCGVDNSRLNAFDMVKYFSFINFSDTHYYRAGAEILDDIPKVLIYVPSYYNFMLAFIYIGIALYVTVLCFYMALKLYEHSYTMDNKGLFIFPQAEKIFIWLAAVFCGAYALFFGINIYVSPFMFLLAIVGTAVSYLIISAIIRYTSVFNKPGTFFKRRRKA